MILSLVTPGRMVCEGYELHFVTGQKIDLSIPEWNLSISSLSPSSY